MKLKTKLKREYKKFKAWNEKHKVQFLGKLSHREGEGFCRGKTRSE